jgi:hypothetical protein
VKNVLLHKAQVIGLSYLLEQLSEGSTRRMTSGIQTDRQTERKKKHFEKQYDNTQVSH